MIFSERRAVKNLSKICSGVVFPGNTGKTLRNEKDLGKIESGVRRLVLVAGVLTDLIM
jgi:hypothetical protein